MLYTYFKYKVDNVLSDGAEIVRPKEEMGFVKDQPKKLNFVKQYTNKIVTLRSRDESIVDL